MAAYELLVIKGPEEGQVYQLEAEEVIIGRDTTCELCFEDRTLSRQHARIIINGENITIEDLGSVNGLLVNGVRLKSSDLKVDDRLTLGNVELLLRPATDHTPQFERLSQPLPPGDEPTLLHQPDAQQIFQPSDSEPASVMNITQTLSSSMLMDLLGRSHLSLGAMYRVTRIASSIFDLDVLLNKILDETFATVRAERGFVLLIDPNTDQLELKSSRWQKKEGLDHKVSISQNIISHVLEKKESVLIADAMADSKFGMAESVVLHQIRSAMCSPLRGRKRIVGIIHVDTTGAGAFSHEDLMLLDAIGNAAGIAVENAQLYKDKILNERLAAMGQAISGLSHYIKNIVAAMDTSHAMVEKALAAEDFSIINRVWKILRRSNQRISNLVLDMLAYSKDRKPDIQPCPINEVCKEAAELCHDRIKTKHGKLQLDLDPKLPRILADPQGIHRCLLNLLTNAIDALDEEGGEVKISTEKHGEGEVLITVEDNGSGIPEEICQRIFDVFFSTKGSQGTGLGLAVTKKIIEEHGGSIEVQSKEDQGTKFFIKLPVGKTADS
ncbi:MAG: ATP-binding protein [Syntrophobacterales bacterium]|jgi:signal transduction histidine kinase/pSer/pThr/pTyr-binding forkhead associated (FHA) protein